MSGLDQPSSDTDRVVGDDAAGVQVFCPADPGRCAAIPGAGVGLELEGDAAVPPALAGAREAVATIAAGIRRLRELKWWTVGERDLLDVTREVETVLRSGFGAQVRLAGELHERGVADMLDARSAAHLLHDTVTITVSDARGRVAAARACLPSENISGATISPIAPELLAAIDAGAVSEGQVKVITRCLAKIPAGVDGDTRRLCRDTLIDQASQRDEIGLRQVAEQILLRVDPDGDLSGQTPEERAELHIGRARTDGLTPVRGALSPLTAQQLRVAIEALAAPRPIDQDTADPRSPELRREQALGEILHRHLTAGAGPRDGGVRPQVVVTISLRDLIGAIGRHRARQADGSNEHASSDSAGGRFGGYAWSDYDGVQTPALARLLACDAAIIPQVLGGESVVLDQGRAMRLFTAAQRRAVTTRDKGCAFPGCDIPPAWCEVHHLIWWSHGGATDISNGVLLCRRHHVLIHQGRWRVDPDPGGGRPRFIPPPHIDPARKPRRNTHFHLPDLLTTISRR